MSPTLGKSIAMGYVDASLREPGTRVRVDVGSGVPAVVDLTQWK